MKKRQRSLVVSLVAVAVVLVVSWRLARLDSHLLALWPSIVALGFVLIFRHVISALVLGAACGALILAGGSPWTAASALVSEHLLPSFQSSWKVGALLFTMFLGGFAAIIERGGGLQSLVHRFVSGPGNASKRLQLGTFALGFLCFFDGLANSILLGRVTRSMAGPCGVSRVKMAYVVDSTSSAIACIAFISTWIATQLSLIDTGLQIAGVQGEVDTYRIFFGSIPVNFYCLFTLLLLLLTIVLRRETGPMLRAELAAQRAATGVRQRSQTTTTAPARSALIPVLALVVGIIGSFYLWAARPLLPVSLSKLANAFSSSEGPWILLLGSCIGILTAFAFWPRQATGSRLDAFLDGAGAMVPPLAILVAAWVLGSVISAMGTAEVIATLLRNSIPLALFPAAVFVAGAFISFTTGTSWGTMGLLMPLVVPILFHLSPHSGVEPNLFLLEAVVAAVFSGAVFGDHCSPFSDTTIVASIATGVEPIAHVKTQLPYAALAAITALCFGFIPLGFDATHPILYLVAGSIGLCLVSILILKPVRLNSQA